MESDSCLVLYDLHSSDDGSENRFQYHWTLNIPLVSMDGSASASIKECAIVRMRQKYSFLLLRGRDLTKDFRGVLRLIYLSSLLFLLVLFLSLFLDYRLRVLNIDT